ncbi:diacylglycerol kinase family protein [Candidatus Omnitrophota bacterium]
MQQTAHTKRSFFRSFRHAIRGLTEIWKHQQNARLILIIAIGVIASGIILQISYIEMVMVLLTIGLVFVAEIFNSMVEETIDLFLQVELERIRIIKDMAAGAVWVSCVIASVVGYFVFIRRLLALLF